MRLDLSFNINKAKIHHHHQQTRVFLAFAQFTEFHRIYLVATSEKDERKGREREMEGEREKKRERWRGRERAIEGERERVRGRKKGVLTLHFRVGLS